MANEQVIDQVIAPVSDAQVVNLTKLLAELDIQMASNIKSANALNAVTGNAKSFKEYQTSATQAAIAIEKIKQAQDNSAKSAAQLEKVNIALANAQARQVQQQQKAKEAAEKALSPYQKLSKELDTLRAHAKDVGAEFGTNSKQFAEASKPVQELDAKLKGIDQTLGQSQRNVGNYGNAFRGVLTQYIPFGDATLRVGENLKALTGDFEESTGKLGTLGAGFAEFTTGAFIVAIASAAYYLSQFKSTGNEVSKFLGGLKEQFANLGGNLVEGVKGFSAKTLLNIFPPVLIYNLGKGFKESFAKGVDDASVKIDLANADELDEAKNRLLKADSEKNRALAANRKLDISDREKYIKLAQKAEQQILDNQKENADLYIANAVAVGDKRQKLTDKQISRLLDGDLEYAQELALSGQQFSETGYELYKKGIEKRIAVKEGATNQLVQLQADGDNLQIRADRGLAQAQERLDKARIQSALDTAKTTLDSDKAGYEEKTKANEAFIKNSLELIEIEKRNKLDSAGVPGRGGADTRTEAKNRAAIEVEAQNEITKVVNDGAANRRKIIKQNNDLYSKDNEEMIKRLVAQEKQGEDNFVNEQNKKIHDIQSFQSQQESSLAKQYADGEISEKVYQKHLFDIQNDSAQQRIQLQIDTLRKIAESQAAALALGFGSPSDIQATGGKIDNLTLEQDKLKRDKTLANAKFIEQQRKDAYDVEKKLAEDTTKFINELVDSSFENQINHIEDLKKATEDQSKQEIEAVNNSILSQADKAKKINLINAQTAKHEEELTEKENQIKRKQAEYNKLASIASIVENTAVAITKTLGETGIFGIPLTAIIEAIGAVQIATVLETPLPKFAQGTDNYPGGLGIWGEAGMERATLPDGTVQYSNGAALANFPKGTKITPHMELMQQIKPDASRYAGGEQIGWKQLLAQMKKLEPKKQRNLTVVHINTEYESYKRKYLGH